MNAFFDAKETAGGVVLRMHNCASTPRSDYVFAKNGLTPFYLPCPNRVNPLSEGPPVNQTEFEGVSPDLDQVVDKGA